MNNFKLVTTEKNKRERLFLFDILYRKIIENIYQPKMKIKIKNSVVALARQDIYLINVISFITFHLKYTLCTCNFKIP